MGDDYGYGYGQIFTNLAPSSDSQTVILFLQNKYRAMVPISFLQRQLGQNYIILDHEVLMQEQISFKAG